MSKSVAVIGGGAGGLTSAKAMLEQGLKVSVFERNSEIGGVWRKSEGNAWPSMHTNASKYNISFSDYHWPKTVPLFPSTLQLHDYLVTYAKRFQVDECIRFNTKVTKLRQLEDKRWLVKWTTADGEQHEETFDCVVLATGSYSHPNIPTYENASAFKGSLVHSMEYGRFKGSTDLVGKNVIVVGHGHSAAEVCSDLVDSGAQVLSVFRRPYWVLKKLTKTDPDGPLGPISLDYFFYNRIGEDGSKQFKTKEEENNFKNGFLSTIAPDQNKFADLYIDPNSTDFVRVAISTNYIEHVKSGKMRVKKGEIKSYTEHGVVFTDGTSEENLDAVVFCTGYNMNFNYFDEDVLRKIEYAADESQQPVILYKATFPHQVENLAFVGMIKEPLFLLLELQARWASLVLSGKLKLPSEEKFLAGLEVERKLRELRPRPQVIRIDKICRYSDEIAEEFGAIPDMEKMQVEHPDLYKILYEGVLSGSHYRLSDNFEHAIEVIRESAEVKDKCLNNKIDFPIF